MTEYNHEFLSLYKTAYDNAQKRSDLYNKLVWEKHPNNVEARIILRSKQQRKMAKRFDKICKNCKICKKLAVLPNLECYCLHYNKVMAKPAKKRCNGRDDKSKIELNHDEKLWNIQKREITDILRDIVRIVDEGDK